VRRILLLLYSQSGDTLRAAESFLAPLAAAPDVQIVRATLTPAREHPFPWRSPRRFFDVLPECILELPPENRPLSAKLAGDFDLIVLAYPVWFLSPALPVQAFFRSPDARRLKDQNVLTISVSRNMWHNAAQVMKRLLREAGAHHRDAIALTHQGPPWATFITTPRALLFGKRDACWKIFPPAGLSDQELERIGGLGETVLERISLLDHPQGGPLLPNCGAVRIQRRYVVPELIGWYVFRTCGQWIRQLGRFGQTFRKLGIYLFMTCLVLLILLVLPVSLLLLCLLKPLYRRQFEAYVRTLAEPSGEGDFLVSEAN